MRESWKGETQRVKERGREAREAKNVVKTVMVKKQKENELLRQTVLK